MFWAFLDLSLFLVVAAVVLRYTGFTSDPKWERWCGQALIVTLVPVVVIPLVRLLQIPINALYVIGVIWGLTAVLFAVARGKRKLEEKKELQETGAWPCRACGAYNPKLNLTCWKCSTSRK